jgi:hypothetical protein
MKFIVSIIPERTYFFKTSINIFISIIIDLYEEYFDLLLRYKFDQIPFFYSKVI